jgi:arginine decarboxylase
LPKYNKKEKPLYIGFFLIQHQEQLADMEVLHCLNSTTQTHILINRDENGIIATEVFSEQQTSDDVLKF